ncbi:PREDICTED: glutamic acid-rich protein-like [Ipomoea nil]|uniref:glutamic acid-rich protein-like n=1 Tax=Ipomoea nil TaxID=35883 RepID=UPI000900CD93|nr:PREDICTED: glutamic acid-rich protein-like [Ipomoea nil]
MQDEEDFALAWIGTEDVSKALRIEEINRVLSYKMTNRTLGRDKAPICIELNKPPLDPLGNEGAQEADPEDSHTILIGPDYDTYPQRSPLRSLPSDSDDLEEVSTSHLEDLSRAIVPLIQPIDETPIKQGKESMREGKLEASPILLSSASGGKREAPPQDDHMDTSPTNIEEESPAESPRTIMNFMRGTVHSAETIHRQYLALREKDTKVMDDLCKKVDFLIAAQSKPRSPPPAQPQPQQQSQSDHKLLERMTKKLYDLEASLNKVARQQHEIKHSHFGLKERVDLACTKIDTYQDNSYQLGEYALQILGYAQDILLTINKVSSIPSTTCADDAKKGEKRNDDKDEDDDQPRDSMKDQAREARHSPSRTPRDYDQRNTNPSHPPSKSRGYHSSKSRYHGRYQSSKQIKPRQSFGSEAKYIFTGLPKREHTKLRQKLMRDNKVTMDGIGNFVDFVPYEEGSGKRFEGCNNPIWLKTKDNYTRQNHMSTQNERIKRANKELWRKHDEERKRKEDEAMERERIRNLIEDLSNMEAEDEIEMDGFQSDDDEDGSDREMADDDDDDSPDDDFSDDEELQSPIIEIEKEKLEKASAC